MDACATLTTPDDNRMLDAERKSTKKRSYCQDFLQSFRWIYLKSKSFDDADWKPAFSSSSFESISRHQNLILFYRTFLLTITLIDLIYSLTQTDPIVEWFIYSTHLTLLITFFAVAFQFLITSRIRFYHGDRIVPRPLFQSIHLILIIVSLGSGFAVCLIYWTMIYHPNSISNLPRTIFDHGLLLFLLFIDVLFFTRLPIYMIDCIPLIITFLIYGLFTVYIYLFQTKFSRNRIGYVYRALNFTPAPLRMIFLLMAWVFIAPVLITFLFWNCFRWRRTIDVHSAKEENGSNLNIDL